MTTDNRRILDFARDLAVEAGNLIHEKRESGSLHTDYKDQQELVTSADIEADQLIIAKIQNAFPDHRILSEETYSDKTQALDLDSPIWIIDPIDGTVNYAHGQNMVAVSIAYAEAGEIQAGAVHNPFLAETFTGLLGEGSWLNGIALSVSKQTVLRQALIATGFPYHKDTIPELLARLQKVLLQCQDVRRLGSAAMDICWVAAGRLDGYYESLSPWDFAAARLIAKEAGARCGHFSPLPEGVPACIHSDDLLITTPGIYDAMNRLLDSHSTD